MSPKVESVFEPFPARMLFLLLPLSISNSTVDILPLENALFTIVERIFAMMYAKHFTPVLVWTCESSVLKDLKEMVKRKPWSRISRRK